MMLAAQSSSEAGDEDDVGTSSRMSIWQDLEANALVGERQTHATLAMRVRTFVTLRYQAALLFRIAQAVGGFSGLLAGVVKQFNQLVTGADIAWQAAVGPGLILHHPVGVVVGPYARLGSEVQLQQGVTIGGDGVTHGGVVASPQLGDRVIVGAGARLIGGISIDPDCIVGANAVVTRDSEGAGMVAIGIPAAWRERRAAGARRSDSA